MARRQRDDEMDELDEAPSPEDLDRFGGVTVTCPKCKSELYDDAAVCWKCGHALASRPENTRPPLWIVIAGGLALLGLMYIMIR